MSSLTRKFRRTAQKREAALRAAARAERRRMLITAIDYAGDRFVDETPLEHVLVVARRELALALGLDVCEVEPGQLFVASFPRTCVADQVAQIVAEDEHRDFRASLEPRAGVVQTVVLHEGATVAALYRLGGKVGFRFTSPGGDA